MVKITFGRPLACNYYTSRQISLIVWYWKRLSIGEGGLIIKTCKNIQQVSISRRVALITTLLFTLASQASFIPSENIDTVTLESDEFWINEVLVEDDAGVLRSIKDTVNNWESKEDYIVVWNQENSGVVSIPNDDSKKNYLTKQLLKYFDKRLSGEIKHADKGSTLYNVGTVHNALKPSSKVDIAPNIKIKFKARVIQGNGAIIIENPFVKCEANFNYRGEAEVRVAKDIKSVDVIAETKYLVKDEHWITSISHKISSDVTGRVSSKQRMNETPANKSADKRVEVFFTHNF